MAEVAAILLAAGLSRRMGTENKLLLPVRGEPMVRVVARTYLSVIDTPLTVVTGNEADAVRAALAGLAVNFAHNAQFEDGQPGSVATGLHAAPDAALLLIGLSDQPQLTPRDLIDLITGHRNGDPTRITIPVRNGARGNPIVIPRALRPRLLENPDRPGCMRFTRDHPDLVHTVDLAAPGFYTDIDTAEDYARHVLAQETAQ